MTRMDRIEELAARGGPRAWPEPYPEPFYGASLIGEEEIAAASDVLRSRSLFRYYGPAVLGRADRFEAAFARFLDVPHALGVSSGTAALRVALAASGIGPGDEVIVPAFTFIATANAVVSLGAQPVFADVDAGFGLDAGDVRRRLGPRTRAVIAVHIQGAACDLDPLVAVCRERGLTLIEDCAQSCGARYRGRQVGSIGDAAAFSFQQNKLLSTGEGGAVCFRTARLYERARIYHDQGGLRAPGQFPTFDAPDCFFGDNLRMSELTAAIAEVQLGRLPGLVARLRAARSAAQRALAHREVPWRAIPDPAGDAAPSLCVVTSAPDRRDAWLAALRAEGVPATAFYGVAVPEYDLFRRPRGHQAAAAARGEPGTARPSAIRPSQPGECPRAEELARRAVWIPVHPTFGPREGERLALAIDKVLHHLGA